MDHQKYTDSHTNLSKLFSSKTELGRKAEEYVASTFQARGYSVVSRNKYYFHGEIDLVVSKGREVCFIEVRSMVRGSSLRADERVSYSKTARVKRCANLWLSQNNHYSMFEVRLIYVIVSYVVSIKEKQFDYNFNIANIFPIGV